MQENMKDQKDDLKGDKVILGDFPEGALVYSYMNPKTKIITPRDFLIFRRKYESDGRVVQLAASIEDDQLKPPVKGFIRGVMTFQASIFEKVDEGKTKVTFLGHFDPNDSISTFLLNTMAKRQGEMMKKVKQFIMEK
jgi:hypothetical protein